MATEFLMPKLGLTMEEGTITEWLVADGATVDVGVAVLRIETDKTETDVESVAAGRLHVVGQAGQTFACGERIAWVLAPGEQPPASGAPAPAVPAATAANLTPTIDHGADAEPAAMHDGGRIIASPLAKRLARERGLDLRGIRGTGPGQRVIAIDLEGVTAQAAVPAPAVPVAAAVRPPVTGAPRPATAAARQLADLLGVDIALVADDPVDGYVTRESVARYVRGLLGAAAAPADGAAPPAAVPTAGPALPPALQQPSSIVRLSGIRGTIAKRMRESLSQMAQLTLFMDADFDAVVADRARRAAHGSAPSFTDYIIAAAARALLQHPIANSQITDDGVALLPVVHVGMAVALDAGLIVPVISQTAARDLASLSAETSRLAAAARAGSLTLPELEGGTFSVSTLGMFGVDGFTPVINPPNTCILGVGRLRDDIVLQGDGSLTTTKRLTLSLTWDHRAFDGAPAAAFCATIVALLNDPEALDTPIAEEAR
jgi:pyruvate dehydrogenase E2 component (dihydrolipoamide acetyltransferase)